MWPFDVYTTKNIICFESRKLKTSPWTMCACAYVVCVREFNNIHFKHNWCCSSAKTMRVRIVCCAVRVFTTKNPTRGITSFGNLISLSIWFPVFFSFSAFGNWTRKFRPIYRSFPAVHCLFTVHFSHFHWIPFFPNLFLDISSSKRP